MSQPFMRTKIPFYMMMGLLILSLAACSSNRKGRVPDEFQVVSRAPLVMPPNADLAPPKPGAPRAQEINPGRQAYEALFPGADFKRRGRVSKGEAALLSRLGSTDPDVRSNLGQKDLDVVKKTILLADLLAAGERTYRPDNVTVNRVAGGR